MSYVEAVKNAIKEAKKDVEKTGTPRSIAILENDRWTLQLLVTPPATVTYGATTVSRHSAVLLSIRSRVNWKNNLTIPDQRGYEALLELMQSLEENKELKEAVLSSVTGRVEKVTPTIKIELK